MQIKMAKKMGMKTLVFSTAAWLTKEEKGSSLSYYPDKGTILLSDHVIEAEFVKFY